MIAVLSAFSTFLGVSFIAYVAFILVPFLRRPRVTPGDPSRFAWHVFVPCRDEQSVIAATIVRARTDFPMAHLWVIDDDSDDATAAVAEGFAASDGRVHVVRRHRPAARTGKGDALNAAYRALDAWLPTDADRARTIVVVVDADGAMSPNALEVVASPSVFGDERVGAAQIAVWMRNRDDPRPLPGRGRLMNAVGRYLIRMQDLEFRTVIAAMQSLRARTGTVGLGGNGQFTRLDVLDAIGARAGAPWHGALLEDYELGVHVLLAGYQVRHVDETHVSQEALPSLRRLLTQRTRWAQGNIQCVKYVAPVLRSRYFDSAGVLETTYYLVLPFLQMLGLAAQAVIWAVVAVRAATDPAELGADVRTLWAVLALVVVFSVAPFALWGPVYRRRCEPGASWSTGVLWGLGVWLYVYYMYVCIARAFLRIATRRTGWSKTRRNADAHVAGAVAVEH